MNARSYVTEEQGRLNDYAIEPKMYVDSEQQFGWNQYAEQLSGRTKVKLRVERGNRQEATGNRTFTILN